MLRRWQNTILYTILMIAQITAFAVLKDSTFMIIIIILGIIRATQVFFPKIVAEFRGIKE